MTRPRADACMPRGSGSREAPQLLPFLRVTSPAAAASTSPAAPQRQPPHPCSASTAPSGPAAAPPVPNTLPQPLRCSCPCLQAALPGRAQVRPPAEAPPPAGIRPACLGRLRRYQQNSAAAWRWPCSHGWVSSACREAGAALRAGRGTALESALPRPFGREGPTTRGKARRQSGEPWRLCGGGAAPRPRVECSGVASRGATGATPSASPLGVGRRGP